FDDLVALHAGRSGIPQRQGRDAVGVQELGRGFELGKAGQEVAGTVEFGMTCLEQNLPVTLDDDRIGRVQLHSQTMRVYLLERHRTWVLAREGGAGLVGGCGSITDLEPVRRVP